jgi:hypothetical protein
VSAGNGSRAVREVEQIHRPTGGARRQHYIVDGKEQV